MEIEAAPTRCDAEYGAGPVFETLPLWIHLSRPQRPSLAIRARPFLDGCAWGPRAIAPRTSSGASSGLLARTRKRCQAASRVWQELRGRRF